MRDLSSDLLRATMVGTSLKNVKREAVAQAYCADLERIGWKAYQEVYPGPSQRASEVAFSRLLKNAEFAARVGELDAAITDKAIEVSGITKARVLQELATLGFANMLDFIKIGPHGLPYLDLSAVTSEQAAAIKDIVVVTAPAVVGKGGEALEPVVIKLHLKLADKKGPLTELAKHLGLYPKGR